MNDYQNELAMFTDYKTSQRLKELGLNEDSADMYLRHVYGRWLPYLRAYHNHWKPKGCKDIVYSWSLAKLLSFLPASIFGKYSAYDLEIKRDAANAVWIVTYACTASNGKRLFMHTTYGISLLEAVCDMFIYLIADEQINLNALC